MRLIQNFLAGNRHPPSFRDVNPELYSGYSTNHGWNKFSELRDFHCEMRKLADVNFEIGTQGGCLRSDRMLIDSLAGELRRGCELIDLLSDRIYRRTANGTGSVGGHFRHNLDFVLNLLAGIDRGWIDYVARERNVRIETDRKFAFDKLYEAASNVCRVNDESLKVSIRVLSETDRRSWFPSSIGRELEFVHSHTVHHHALIAEKLAGFGVAVGGTFGVAPSTLEYWRTRAA